MAKTVLVAEDEPSIALALTFVLERDGFAVATTADGLDVIDEVRERNPDALILDAMLPRRDGYEILRLLRSEETTRALPVLMLTAKGQKSNRDEAMASGANSFLVKPYSNNELLDVVRRLTA